MPTYTVVTPLKNGGELLEPGSPVDLKAKDAKDLLASGAIAKGAPQSEPAPANAPASQPGTEPDGTDATGAQDPAQPPENGAQGEGGNGDSAKDGGDPPQA